MFNLKYIRDAMEKQKSSESRHRQKNNPTHQSEQTSLSLGDKVYRFFMLTEPEITSEEEQSRQIRMITKN